MKPVCSIIIRAYNEEKNIKRLLDGLIQQSLKDIQVILVDSGSTDRTLEIANQFLVEVVHIDPKEFTFGRSLNLGIAHAQADYIVLASAHVYPVYPDWLERLLEPFNDNQVALSYGKQRGKETSQFSEQMIFSHWYPETSNFFQEHPFCNNANAAIRRDLWQQKPYNETLPGLEDLAWARWVQDQSYRIAYVAEAEIIHVHDESMEGIKNRYRREGMAFKIIYPQEKFGLIEMIGAIFTNIFNDFKTAYNQKILNRQWKNIIGFRWNQFFGTYQGYNQSGPLTWQLKRKFYYPRLDIDDKVSQRSVEPIKYQDIPVKEKNNL
jgi:glycosyltransferase involved in cell wall biosynthesis